MYWVIFVFFLRLLELVLEVVDWEKYNEPKFYSNLLRFEVNLSLLSTYDFNKKNYSFIWSENVFVERVHKKAHLDIYYHYRSFNSENIDYIWLPVQV